MFFVDFCTLSLMSARAQRPLKKRAGAERCSFFLFLPDRKLPVSAKNFDSFVIIVRNRMDTRVDVAVLQAPCSWPLAEAEEVVGGEVPVTCLCSSSPAPT